MTIAPRYALAGSIGICLAVWGCASQTRLVEYRYNDCSGQQRRAWVTEVTSATPTIACILHAADYGRDPLLVAFQLPVACVFGRGSEYLMILPWIREPAATHEYEHVAGLTHPAFFPLGARCPDLAANGRP